MNSYSKPFWQSKTLWVNGLGVLGMVLLLATKELTLSEQTLQWVMFGWGVVNIVLRALTGQALSR